MNYLIRPFLCMLMLAGFTQRLPAQVSTFSQGTIVYQTSYPDSSESSTVSSYAFPAEISLYLRNSVLKAEINSLYVNATIFTDLNARTSASYLKVTGKKVKLSTNLDSMLLQAFSRTPYTLEPAAGTMKIYGYVCKKLIAHFYNKAIPDALIYYTPDIPFLPVPVTQAFNRVPGFIMYLEENYQGINLHLKVSRIDPTPLSDQVFARPEGFSILPASEIFSILGKPF